MKSKKKQINDKKGTQGLCNSKRNPRNKNVKKKKREVGNLFIRY